MDELADDLGPAAADPHLGENASFDAVSASTPGGTPPVSPSHSQRQPDLDSSAGWMRHYLQLEEARLQSIQRRRQELLREAPPPLPNADMYRNPYDWYSQLLEVDKTEFPPYQGPQHAIADGSLRAKGKSPKDGHPFFRSPNKHHIEEEEEEAAQGARATTPKTVSSLGSSSVADDGSPNHRTRRQRIQLDDAGPPLTAAEYLRRRLAQQDLALTEPRARLSPLGYSARLEVPLSTTDATRPNALEGSPSPARGSSFLPPPSYMNANPPPIVHKKDTDATIVPYHSSPVPLPSTASSSPSPIRRRVFKSTATTSAKFEFGNTIGDQSESRPIANGRHRAELQRFSDQAVHVLATNPKDRKIAQGIDLSIHDSLSPNLAAMLLEASSSLSKALRNGNWQCEYCLFNNTRTAQSCIVCRSKRLY